MFKKYYNLTKPGIIYGNLITAVGGFLLAAKGHFYPDLLAATIIGTSLVIGSACVFNNLMDRDIDRLMARTNKRALVSGTISARNAVIFATILGIVGISVLGFFTNMVTTLLAAFSFFAYVVLYGIAKRRTVHGTLVGTISGAMPPVIGYVAVTGSFDRGAWLLFAVLVFWQMPHFYAIATYRLSDYTAAKIPVMPAVRGIQETKIWMVGYVVLFLLASLMLYMFGYTGLVYAGVMTCLGTWWLILCLRGFKAKDDAKWARQFFHYSLIVITFFSLAIALDYSPRF